MTRKKKIDLLLENVTIEAVAAEGKALAHVDGMVVFVDFAVPGDIVDITPGIHFAENRIRSVGNIISKSEKHLL